MCCAHSRGRPLHLGSDACRRLPRRAGHRSRGPCMRLDRLFLELLEHRLDRRSRRELHRRLRGPLIDVPVGSDRVHGVQPLAHAHPPLGLEVFRDGGRVQLAARHPACGCEAIGLFEELVRDGDRCLHMAEYYCGYTQSSSCEAMPRWAAPTDTSGPRCGARVAAQGGGPGWWRQARKARLAGPGSRRQGGGARAAAPGWRARVRDATPRRHGRRAARSCLCGRRFPCTRGPARPRTARIHDPRRDARGRSRTAARPARATRLRSAA